MVMYHNRMPKTKELDLGPLTEYLGYALRRASMSAVGEFLEAFQEIGLRPTQFAVLTLIAGNPGVRQTPDNFRTLSREQWDGWMEAHFFSALELIRALVPGMCDRKFGRVVNISVSFIKFPQVNFGHSHAARLALAGATPALAHHSFAMFDHVHRVTVAGTVTKFDWTNPHVYIELAAPDGKGGSARYTIECASPRCGRGNLAPSMRNAVERSLTGSSKLLRWPLSGFCNSRPERPCPRQSMVATAKPRRRKSVIVSKYFSMNSVRP